MERLILLPQANDLLFRISRPLNKITPTLKSGVTFSKCMSYSQFSKEVPNNSFSCGTGSGMSTIKLFQFRTSAISDATRREDFVGALDENDSVQGEYVPLDFLKSMVNDMSQQAEILGDEEGMQLMQRARREAERENCSPQLLLKMIEDFGIHAQRIVEEESLLEKLEAAEEEEEEKRIDPSQVKDSKGVPIVERNYNSTIEDLRNMVTEMVPEIENGPSMRAIRLAQQLRHEIMKEGCTVEYGNLLFSEFVERFDEIAAEGATAEDVIEMERQQGFVGEDGREYIRLEDEEDLKQIVRSSIQELEEVGDERALELAASLRREAEKSDWSFTILSSILQKCVSYLDDKSIEIYREAQKILRNENVDIPDNPNPVPVWGPEMEAAEEELNELKTELNELAAEIIAIHNSGNASGARQLADANLAAVMRQVAGGEQGLEQAAMLHVLSHLYIEMGSEKAGEVLDQTSVLVSGLEEEHMILWDMLSNVGDQNMAMGRFREAAHFFRLCLDALEQKKEVLESRVYPMNGLVSSLCQLDEWEEAEAVLSRHCQLWEAAEGEECVQVLHILRCLGGVYTKTKQFSKAEDTLVRCYKLSKAMAGDDSVEVALTLLYTAMLQEEQGDLFGSIPLYTQGVRILESREHTSLSEDDKVALEDGKRRWRRLLRATNKLEEVEKSLENAVTREESRFAKGEKNHAELLVALREMGNHFELTWQHESALPLHRRTVEVMAGELGMDKIVSEPLSRLAFCHLMVGELEEAEVVARKNLDVCLGNWEPSDLLVGDACSLLAKVLFEKGGSHEEIEALLEVDLKNRISAHGQYSMEVLEPLDALIAVTEKHGNVNRLAVLRKHKHVIKNHTESKSSKDSLEATI